MENQKIEIITFVESVVLRPKMWTAAGSLEEIVALFDGYEMANRHSGVGPKERPTPSDALEWLSEKIDENRNDLSNIQFIEAVRLKFTSDDNALKHLAKWLKEFRIRKKPKK